jgi:CubicO group peptidase (beta-lactamase class C family)
MFHFSSDQMKAKSILRNTCLFFLFNLINVAISGQQLYYPEAGKWHRKRPEDIGISYIGIQEAIDFAVANEYSGSRDLRIAILDAFSHEPYHEIVGPVRERGGPAGLIVKDGYIVGEWGDPERVDMTFSVTKIYLSTVCGLALDHQLIRSVDDRVKNYVWDGTYEGAHNSKITWHHLLNQSSDWSGNLFGMYDWADRPSSEGGIDDWKNRSLHEPGTHYKYNDVRVNVLAYSLLQVWRKPLPVVLKEQIMDPISASTTWRWFGYSSSWVNVDGTRIQSVSGGGHSGGGIFISTIDHARFGLLFLRGGKWKNQQIISEEWIDQMQIPSEANESYGYLWWLNRGEREWEGLSENIYYAAGFGGNYIVIDEEHDLVVVTRWLEPLKLGNLMRLIVEAVK